MQDLIDRLRAALDRLFPAPATRPVPVRVRPEPPHRRGGGTGQ
ncbi:hypothetical protein [Dinoroseobacter sp. S124A]